MLDTKSQARAAGAAQAMLWAWPLATARVADAWMSRSWTVWSQLLHPVTLPVPPLWPLAPALWPAPTVVSPQDGHSTAEPPAAAAADPGFASYRSPGGHAATQVLRPE
jgi:hypothetical protein